MKEEKNGGSKNNWTRIFRKKWFFPAVYLGVAALLLTFVVWYQNVDNQIPGAQDNQETTDNTATEGFNGKEDAQTVTSQQEVVKMPVSNQDKAEIVTKFYDYNADEKAKESALVFYNNRYYQSTGVDIATSEGETFDVTASLSGTVEEVKEDPLLGNVVKLSHENDLATFYASLGEVKVKQGTEVEQGDVLGTAGSNLFGKDAGTHVHFEVRKNDNPVNPETYFNQPVNSIKVEDESKSDDVEKDSNEDSDGQSTKPEDETSGSEDDTTNSDDGSQTEDPAEQNQEDPTGTGDDEKSSDDATDQENGMSTDDAESSRSSASA